MDEKATMRPHEWTTDETYGHQVCVRCCLATTLVTPAHERIACLTPEERAAQLAEWNRRVNDTFDAVHYGMVIQWPKTPAGGFAAENTPPLTVETLRQVVKHLREGGDPFTAVTEGALCPATPDHREGRVCVLCRGKGWIPLQD